MKRKIALVFFILFSAARASFGFESIVILPFANKSEKQEVYWLGEGFAESLREELLLKDVAVIPRKQRNLVYDDLRLPYISDLSRATMLKIGEKLGADYMVFGSYTLKDSDLSVEARVIRLSSMKLSDAVTATGSLDHLYDVQRSIRDGLVQFFGGEKLVPLEATFPGQSVPLHAYEAYIKGLLETSDNERIKFFQRAIQASPGYMQAVFRMGQTLSRLQRYKDSTDCLNKGKFSEPLASKVKFLIGMNAYLSQSYDEALQIWQDLAETQPSAEVYNNIGITLMQKKSFQDSGWYSSKAVEQDPVNPDYRFNLAASYILRDFAPNAIQEYRDLIKRRNDDYQTFYLLGKLLEKNASGDKQKEIASKIILQFFRDTLPTEQKGKFPELYSTVLQLLRPAPDFLWTEERQYLSAAQEKNLDDFASYVRTYQASARKYIDDNDPANALLEIRKGSGLNPLDWYLHYLSGLAQSEQKNSEAAEMELQFSLWCQENVESHLMLAELYRGQEKYADAKIQIQQSLALDPNNKKALEIWNKIWDKK